MNTDVAVFMQLILSVHTFRGQVVSLFSVDLIILSITIFCCMNISYLVNWMNWMIF